MGLTAGARLGPYEIQSALGAGGMGEVYRATDTRLDRTVAIKVLPEHVASDPDLKQRFEREAKTLAALSHPHICPVFDVGSQDGVDFLVMECLDGETLEQRLKKGALPLDQALQYAIQIADALDKAHRKGIVHRDLKPANVMLTKAGVKLLDFGLAKLQPAAGAVVGMSLAATVSSPLTGQGTILGTLHYMAPEQVEGKDADTRSDIFSFGALVYEMATGKRAFEGTSAASVMAAILEREPPTMSSLQPLTPPLLDHVVTRCLVKDADERWQSARDLMRELTWIAESRAHPAAPSSAASQAALGARMVPVRMAGILAGVACLLAGVLVWNLKPTVSAPAPGPVRRTVMTLDQGEQLALADLAPLGVGRVALAFSPDGAHLAYVVDRGGQSYLRLRRMDELEGRLLPGTEGAFNPFFSPDGQWVGFFTPTHLKKISIRGGMPETVCEATNAHGASWGSDNRIVFANAEGAELSLVSALGGEPQVLLQSTWDEGAFHQADVLPDRKGVLVTLRSGSGADAHVEVISLENGNRRVVVERGGGARYVPTGHLVYTAEGGVQAVPFDLATLTVQGSAAPLLPDVRREHVGREQQLTFSADGWLAYVRGDDMGVATPVWVDRATRMPQPIPLPSQRYGAFRLSPDGTRLAIQINGTTSDIWIYDFARATPPSRLTGGGNNQFPIWRPDGRRVTFFSDRDSGAGIYEQALGGAAAERLLAVADNRRFSLPNSWSRGGVLAFDASSVDSKADAWVLPSEKGGEPQPFALTAATEWGPAFSPDGRWIAYTSDESGQYQVYVKRYPATGERWQISTAYGEEPLWSTAGDEIFFRQGREWFSVSVRTEPEFEHLPPRLLFSGSYLNVPGLSYDVTPDGRRFFLLKQREQPPATQIQIVANWFEELKRLVPTK